MKQYPTYKESGVQWIGQIPEHWNVCHLWWLLEHMTTGLNPRDNFKFKEDGEYFYVTIANFKDGQLFLDEKCDRIDKDAWNIIQERSDLQKGDILFASISRNGQAYIVNEFPANWNINESVFKLRFMKNVVDTNFAYYVLTDDSFYNEMQSEATGATFQSIKQNKLKLNTLPLPPFAEQQAIAKFLDFKTAKIDETISLYEQQKADLVEYRKALISDTVTRGLNPNVPLKDSGIQWLGQIPEGWKIVPLKFLLASGMMYGANESADEPNMEWPRYIRITDIAENGSLKDETYMSLSPDKAADYMLQKGDILFARSGATVGKTYMFNENYPACFAGYLIKATCGKDRLPEFLLKYTQSSVYENWKNSIYIQSTIQNIGADKYNQMPIPVPSLAEQQAIVSFLDSKTAMIDEAIRRIDEQIADLKAYRTALITDAVTGKIDVR